MLALAAGLAGYGLGTRREPPSSPFAALGRSEAILAAALTEDPDGGRRAFDGGEVQVGSTFRLEGGRTCRTFEVVASEGAPVSGLSCREGGTWRVTAALLDARHADSPLPADEVARLRAAGWGERR